MKEFILGFIIGILIGLFMGGLFWSMEYVMLYKRYSNAVEIIQLVK